ncbi:hypothetical protein PtA15_8A256 [Puccinia triticina]|uniref:Uncharacterized protein n=1 Tax=Puccinia triticina TaxID=208348 RepID=A0ABY7CS93_9BASI|nr:uncharacterized protein PtA15_8A256 [Puccinia triticina]WAQ87352.1 hypothetical protein PtA15_8A256 [Puccinia triticina]WAR57204.1 hypothetical protein PtB15_8B251 [Puccinia triticina]
MKQMSITGGSSQAGVNFGSGRYVNLNNSIEESATQEDHRHAYDYGGHKEPEDYFQAEEFAKADDGRHQSDQNNWPW